MKDKGKESKEEREEKKKESRKRERKKKPFVSGDVKDLDKKMK